MPPAELAAHPMGCPGLAITVVPASPHPSYLPGLPKARDTCIFVSAVTFLFLSSGSSAEAHRTHFSLFSVLDSAWPRLRPTELIGSARG